MFMSKRKKIINQKKVRLKKRRKNIKITFKIRNK